MLVLLFCVLFVTVVFMRLFVVVVRTVTVAVTIAINKRRSNPFLFLPPPVFQLLEVFGTGTAALIAPVRAIKYNGRDIEVNGTVGPIKNTSLWSSPSSSPDVPYPQVLAFTTLLRSVIVWSTLSLQQ